MNLGDTHLPPLGLLADIGSSMLRLQRRSLAADSAALIAATSPRPRCDGLEHIPSTGPLLLVANHYQRPGLWIGYAGALIADAVWQVRQEEVRMMVIDRVAWTRDGRPASLPGSRWIFRRIAAVWDMTAMPVGADERQARGAAVRRLVASVAPPPRGRGRVGVLFPEGDSGHHRFLSPALPGVGSLLLLLCTSGVRLAPVGIGEEGGRVVARIGKPFVVAAERRVGTRRDREEDDRRAREEVMARIAALLPPALRSPS